MKRLVLNAKTDCQNNIKEKDAFYWVVNLMGENGYKQIKNGATIKECVFENNMVHYSVELTEWYVDLDNTVRLDVIEIRENNSLDEKYLMNDLVENCNYEISENKVEIIAGSTCFVRENKYNYESIENTLEAYKKLVKLCKNRGIKVGYSNHYKKLLSENKDTYNHEVLNANNLFDTMKEVALQVQNRGIHYGCDDDKILNHLHEVKSKYQACHYRNTILSKIIEINNRIFDYIDNIENEYSDYTKICL